MHAKAFAKFIADETGIPVSTMQNATRRMAENGIISLGSRGRAAPEVTPIDVAKLILAALTLGDGIETVMSRTPARVRELEDLGFSTDISIAKNDSLAEIDAAASLAGPGTLSKTIAQLALAATTGTSSTDLSNAIRRIGITYSGPSIAAWIELHRGYDEPVGVTRGKYKNAEYSMHQDNGLTRLVTRTGNSIGFAREIALDWASFERLAAIAAADNPMWG